MGSSGICDECGDGYVVLYGGPLTVHAKPLVSPEDVAHVIAGVNAIYFTVFDETWTLRADGGCEERCSSLTSTPIEGIIHVLPDSLHGERYVGEKPVD